MPSEARSGAPGHESFYLHSARTGHPHSNFFRNYYRCTRWVELQEDHNYKIQVPYNLRPEEGATGVADRAKVAEKVKVVAEKVKVVEKVKVNIMTLVSRESARAVSVQRYS